MEAFSAFWTQAVGLNRFTVSNVSGHLADGVSEKVLTRAFEYWRNVDAKIGERIEKSVRDMIGGTSEEPGMASAKATTPEMEPAE